MTECTIQAFVDSQLGCVHNVDFQNDNGDTYIRTDQENQTPTNYVGQYDSQIRVSDIIDGLPNNTNGAQDFENTTQVQAPVNSRHLTPDSHLVLEEQFCDLDINTENDNSTNRWQQIISRMINASKTVTENDVKYTELLRIMIYYPRNIDGGSDLQLVNYCAKILFWIISLAGILHSLCIAKTHLIIFTADRELDTLTYASNYIVVVVVLIYFAHFLGFCRRQTLSLLNKWDEYDAKHTKRVGSVTVWNQVILKVVFLSYLASQLVAILKSFLCEGTSNWTYNGTIKCVANQFAHGLFLWSFGKENVENKSQEISLRYYSDINKETTWMGWAGLAHGIAVDMRLQAVRDLLIVLALINRAQVRKFLKRISEQRLLREFQSAEEAVQNEILCWNHYRELQSVIAGTNRVFDGILNIVHIQNLLLFAFLLEDLLDKNTGAVHISFLVNDLGKAALMYYIARSTASQNPICQEWIEKLPCDSAQFCVERVRYTRELMLQELKRCPLGLGGYVINDNFLTAFIAFVLSMFGVMVGLHNYD